MGAAELQAVSEGQQKLSVSDRLRLIRTLNALPAAQFDELVFALKPHGGNVPGAGASQGSRSKVLLDWAESAIGPGIPQLEMILEQIVAARPESSHLSNTQSQQIAALEELIQILKDHQASNQVPKYDLRGAQFAGGFAETVRGDQTGGNQVTPNINRLGLREQARYLPIPKCR